MSTGARNLPNNLTLGKLDRNKRRAREREYIARRSQINRRSTDSTIETSMKIELINLSDLINRMPIILECGVAVREEFIDYR